MGGPKSQDTDEDAVRLAEAVNRWLDRDFGGRDRHGARADFTRTIGCAASATTRLLNSRRDAGVTFVRRLARFLPDAVADYVHLPRTATPRRPMWPELATVLDRQGFDARTEAYGRLLNEAWEVERSPGEWYDDLHNFEVAHRDLWDSTAAPTEAGPPSRDGSA